MTNIKIFANPNELSEFAANDFANRAITAIQEKGTFSVVLAGGNTPILFFDCLTRLQQKVIPWKKIRFFFGDERYVAKQDARNNYHMAYEHLFAKVSIDPNNIFRIPTECANPNDAAFEYSNTLRKIFGNAYPSFDLTYLGLGEDAHTASLMPLSDLVKRATKTAHEMDFAAALFVSDLKMYRITLTPDAINHSQNIIFFVTGANKAKAVREVLESPSNPILYPAQLIHSLHGQTIWYLDQEAAEELTDAN